MAIEDVRITEQVRRVLARHWIDPAELRFSCTRGTLRFHGTLRRLPTEERLPLNEPLLETITQEIKRVRGVQKVYFTGVQLDERWVEVEEESEPQT